MTISGDAVTVDGEPVDLLGDRMAARVAGHVLVVVRPQNIADDSDFRDVGRLPFLQVASLGCDEACKIVMKEHDPLHCKGENHAINLLPNAVSRLTADHMAVRCLKFSAAFGAFFAAAR